MSWGELANTWYSILTTVNAAMAEPLMGLSASIGVPIVAVLLLGLLGATAPCQVTTAVSALAVVTRRLDTPHAPLLSTAAYLLGKVLVYTVVGTAVVLVGRELATSLIPAIGIVRKALGPLMILIGLFFLGLPRPPVSLGHGLSAWLQQHATVGGTRGSFLLGVAYAFAFCPTLFWLFFGLTIPLAVGSPLGIVYPAVFALGTTLPLLGLAGLLSAGSDATRAYLTGTRRAGARLRPAAAAVLLLTGLHDTVIYWWLV